MLASDQRGHGKSQRFKDGAYTIIYHFQHLPEFTETLELNRLDLIDHFMGGRKPLYCAACTSTYMDRVMLGDAPRGENRLIQQMLRYFLLILPRQGPFKRQQPLGRSTAIFQPCMRFFQLQWIAADSRGGSSLRDMIFPWANRWSRMTTVPKDNGFIKKPPNATRPICARFQNLPIF